MSATLIELSDVGLKSSSELYTSKDVSDTEPLMLDDT